MVMDGACTALSKADTIVSKAGSLIEKPVVTKNPNQSAICGGSILYEVKNTNSYISPTYVWYNTDGVVQNAGSSYQTTEAGVYFVQVLEGNCSVVSAKDTLRRLVQPLVTRHSATDALCENGSIILEVSNTEAYASTAIYQWYNNGIAIIGATGKAYEATEEGKYYIEISEGSCKVSSRIDTIVSKDGDTIVQPTITNLSIADALCEDGGSILLKLSNSEDYGQATYQWFRNNMSIAGATDVAYEVIEAGNYRVMVMDGECTALSNAETIGFKAESIEKPLVSRHAASDTLCGSSSGIILELTTAYTSAANYQWYKDNTAIAGATGKVYEVTEAGNYRIMVTDGECTALSKENSIVAKDGSSIIQPLVSRHAASDTLCGGNGSIILEISNAEDYTSAAKYQWFRNNAAIAGATNAAYEVTEAGNYRIMVMDGECTALSEADTIVSNGGSTIVQPLVTRHPATDTLCGENGSIVLEVSNKGVYTSATYQWFKNNRAMAGATTAVYVVTEAGNYRIMVMDGECTALSKADTIVSKAGSLIEKPVVTKNPNQSAICEGINILYEVTNTGSYTSPTYIWYNTDGIVQNGGTSSYEATEAGVYFVQVIEGNCSAVSVKDTIKRLVQPLVTRHSATDALCENGSIILEVSNAEDYTSKVTYQWFENNTLISGATEKAYEVTEEGKYHIEVSEGSCVLSSSIDTIVSKDEEIVQPTITNLSLVDTLCGENGSILLKLSNSGDYGQATYQWFKNNMSIEGATDMAYEVTEAGNYRIMVMDGECTALSVADTIVSKVGSVEKPLVSRHAASDTLCGSNSSIILELTTAYTSAASYQWYKDNTAIANATEKIYEVTEAGKYRIMVTDGECTALSKENSIVAKDGSSIIQPLVTRHAASDTLCGGNGSIILEISNAKDYTSAATYQWLKDNMVIADATNAAYEVTEAGNYRIMVMDGECTALSETDTIVSNGGSTIVQPTITNLSASNTLCGENGSIVLELSNKGAYTSATYQWFRNNIAIAGATTAVYVVTEAGNYRIMVMDGECTALSNADTIVVREGGSIDKPIVAKDPVRTTICDGDIIEYSVTNANAYVSPMFVWYSTDSLVQNGGSSYRATEAGVYFVQVLEGNCSAVSTNDTIKRLVQPLVTRHAASDTLCGDNGRIILEVSNVEDYTSKVAYQWYNNGTVIIGAIEKAYEVIQEGKYHIEVSEGSCMLSSSIDTIVYKAGGTIVQPTIANLSLVDTLCGENGSILLKLSNRGDYGQLAIYQWFKNNMSIAGATDTAYEVTEAGNYRILIMDGACTALSNADTIVSKAELIEKPLVTRHATSDTLCGSYSSIILELTTAYTSAATYQWYKDNTAITGATERVYEVTEAGKYRIMVADGECTALSKEDTIVFRGGSTMVKPLLSRHAASDTLCGGNGSIILEISNAEDYASAATYQWFKNNMSIAGATERVYEVTAAGDYRIMVMDGECTALSETDTIVSNGGSTIIQPTITNLSASNTLCGEEGSIILEISNSEDYGHATYQWFKNNRAIAGATTAVYVVTEAGDYRIMVMDGECTALSEADTIVVNEGGSITKPEIRKTPDQMVICQDGSIRYDVVNTDSYTNPTYIWYTADSVVQRGGSSYQATEAGVYFVQVLEGNCSTVSAKDTLRSLAQPFVTRHAASDTLCVNGSIILELTTVYTSAVECQWYKDDIEIAGATGRVYEVTDTGKYYVVVQKGSCVALSETDTIVSKANGSISKPVVSKTPDQTAICDGASILYEVVNDVDYTEPTYVWYTTDGVVQNGGSSYQATEAGVYFVQVLDGNCSAVSARDTLKRVAQPQVTRHSVSDTLCENGSIILELTTVYTSTVAYQWYNNDNPITGATEKAYEVTEAGEYYLTVQKGGCEVSSSLYTIVANGGGFITPPEISRHAATDTLCGENSSIVLEISNTEDYTSEAVYQWVRNNTVIAGATDAVYEVTEAGNYRIMVIDGECIAVSQAETIIFKGESSIVKPEITKTPDQFAICENGSILYEVTNDVDYTDPTYIWYSTDSMVQNGGSSSYQATEAGVYFVQVVDGSCSAVSARDTLQRVAQPLVTRHAASDTLCGVNGSIILELTTVYTSSATYQWYKDDAEIAGATERVYEVTDMGEYHIAVLDGGCTVLSSIDTIVSQSGTTIAKPLVTKTPNQTDFCEGGSMLYEVDNVSDYTDPIFIWYNTNGVVQNGGSSYRATQTGVYFVQVLDEHCSAVSARETLTVYPLPTATLTTSQQTVILGDSVELVALTGTAPWTITYRDRQNTYTVSGITSPSYWFKPTEMGANIFTLVSVEDANCSNTANGSAVIIAIARTKFVTVEAILPSDSQACVDETIALSFTGTPPFTLEYTLEYNNTVVPMPAITVYQTDTAIALTNEGQYIISFVSLVDGDNDNGLSLTDTVVLTVYPLPTASLAISNDTVYLNDSVALITLTGTAPWTITYNDGNGDQIISGIASSPYWFEAAAIGTYSFTLIGVEDANCSNGASGMATLTVVQEPIQIIRHPVIQEICTGEGFILEVEAIGSIVTYQWYKDDSPIPGANASNYAVDSASVDDYGNYYVLVIGKYDTLSSNVVEVRKNPVELILEWGNMLDVENLDQRFVQFDWYKDGQLLSAGKQQYYIGKDEEPLVGTYYVICYYRDGTSVTSCPMTLTSSKKLKMSIFPNPVYRNSLLTIIFDEGSYDLDGATLQLYDALGKMHTSQILNGETTIKVTAPQESGVYVVRIITKSGEVINERFIVNK
jgi:hypothetical protein